MTKIYEITKKITFANTASVLLFVLFAYSIYSQISITKNIEKTNSNLETINQDLNQKITNIEEVLIAAEEKNLTLAEALEQSKKESESLAKQFARVNKNVDELEKITLTDKELLQKYSKVYFLNEHYSPTDLAKIPSEFTYDKNRTYQIHDEVIPYLEDLLEDARDDGMDLLVASAFRSFGEQATLKGAYTVTYGAGTANQFSADQGYSEHQLGTTVDFTNSKIGGAFNGFSQTAEYKWLQDNAHKYGFTLSYPENNAYYQFEPWHWRFVGEKLATDLYEDGKFFYDITQREIDEYIVDLFD